MGEFDTRNVIPLWSEICKQHWTYLETEESLQKIKERCKLEKCLLEYLSVVPHDRKFLLPETSHVLKKSILYMPNFSASKASAGFESIANYANNLFTKPWRKEYKTIKMYSGFFQHEIKNNLLDSERLFEAMGYKRMSADLLVLDEAICPDQVTNVSRDAMAGYVECQIMKEIYSGLTELQLSCSLIDIYNFREQHIGTASQIIKFMSYNTSDELLCSKFYNDSFYSQIQPGVCSYSNSNNNISNNAQCAIHNKPRSCISSNAYYQAPCNGQPKPCPFAIPHSRSLDQYDQDYFLSNRLSDFTMHRHSLDQPYNNSVPMNSYQLPIPNLTAYDMNYGTNNQYLARDVDSFQDYNVPRNRVPLDHNAYSRYNDNITAGRSRYKAFPTEDLPSPYTFPSPELTMGGIKQPIQGILKKDSAFGRRDRDLHASNIEQQQHQQQQHIKSKNHRDIETNSSSKLSLSSDFASNDDEGIKVNSKSANRHQEGVGSYESWNYVFQNLEQQKSNVPNEQDSSDFDVVDNFTGMHLKEKSHAMSKKESPTVSKPVSKAKNSNMKSNGDGKLYIKENSIPNEWSCKFCTFLNAQSKQICDMCSKSKDFNAKINAGRSSASRSTCV